MNQIVQGFAQVKRNSLKLQLAGFHAGDIQQVIDDGRQAFRGIEQGIHILPLLLVQRRVGQQIGVTEDRLKRNTQLVADIGQELILGVIGPDGFVPFALSLDGGLP